MFLKDWVQDAERLEINHLWLKKESLSIFTSLFQVEKNIGIFFWIIFSLIEKIEAEYFLQRKWAACMMITVTW